MCDDRYDYPDEDDEDDEDYYDDDDWDEASEVLIEPVPDFDPVEGFENEGGRG